MADSIDRILATRRPATTLPEAEPDGDKFFSILVGDGSEEQFLELRLQDGLRICLSYGDLSWFSYDPAGPKLDLEFGTIFVTIKGRGMDGKLFDGIKHKRLAWIKEADSEMQDTPSNATFVEEISFELPKEQDANEEAAE